MMELSLIQIQAILAFGAVVQVGFWITMLDYLRNAYKKLQGKG